MICYGMAESKKQIIGCLFEPYFLLVAGSSYCQTTELCAANKLKVYLETQNVWNLLFQIFEMGLHLELSVLQIYGKTCIGTFAGLLIVQNFVVSISKKKFTMLLGILLYMPVY